MSGTKKRLSIETSDSNPWDRLGSPTLWSPTSGIPLQDGLYVDKEFPMNVMQIPTDVEWKRPKEICAYPQFIIDGATRTDVCQGVLQDCWFLSAVASLSLNPSLMNRVIPSGQNFQQGYNGSFCFRFWQYGEWIKIRVDDRLPTRKGKLIYLRSENEDEFWSALLEKAYAKLNGGYNGLNMGFPHEAMADMTGGITEVFKILTLPQDLGSFLHPLLQKGALINCGNTQGDLGKSNEFGILLMHAYSVTGLEMIKTTMGSVMLVRIRNPWGNTEWKGAWSDEKGKEWDIVSPEEQRRVQRVRQNDGEFWMTLSDFRQNFDKMEVCHLSDDTLNEDPAIKRPWQCTAHHGIWITSLGPPQFNLTLFEEDDDPSDSEQTCLFMLALMQKHSRQRGLLPVALHIFKAQSEHDFLSQRDVSQFTPVLSSVIDNVYVPQRELVMRGRLPPGHYIIIPTTENNQPGEFLLRVLTEKGNNSISKPVERPAVDANAPIMPLSPRLQGLPSTSEAKVLFIKHATKGSHCKPLDLYNLLTEAIAKGVFAGSEQKLSLEHCKSFVALMDTQGMGRLDLTEFMILWDKLRRWTNIFMTFDKNKNKVMEYQEISRALPEAGIQVDEFILQLIGLRYTEPDMTVSFPGFLFLLMKLDSMIRKFHSYDIVGMGKISVNLRQFLLMTTYN